MDFYWSCKWMRIEYLKYKSRLLCGYKNLVYVCGIQYSSFYLFCVVLSITVSFSLCLYMHCDSFLLLFFVDNTMAKFYYLFIHFSTTHGQSALGSLQPEFQDAQVSDRITLGESSCSMLNSRSERTILKTKVGQQCWFRGWIVMASDTQKQVLTKFEKSSRTPSYFILVGIQIPKNALQKYLRGIFFLLIPLSRSFHQQNN